MRQRYTTYLAAGIGILVVLVVLAFAWAQYGG